MCYTENFFTAPCQRLLGMTSLSGQDLLQRPGAWEDKAIRPRAITLTAPPLQVLLGDDTLWLNASCLIVRPSTNRNLTHKHLIGSSRLPPRRNGCSAWGRGGSWVEVLPVHHGASVQGHEENLTAASRTHRGEEHLEERDTHTLDQALWNRFNNVTLNDRKK